MNQQRSDASGAADFPGFDRARRIMWCHETRARVFKRLELTGFIVDTSVEAVHVDNITRGDWVFLTAFDDAGRRVSADMLPVVEPCDHLAVAAEFDHDYTEMPVTPGSELEEVVAREDGWVVNMDAVRDYDIDADRRATQKAVVLAHLPDLMQSGDARGFLLGPDESDGAGAA